jgi:hypothetical protein
MTDICGSGHYGSSFSMAEIVSVLYYRFMHVRPHEPQWTDRALHDGQGPRRDRPVPGAQRPRLLPAELARRLHPFPLASRRPPRHEEGASSRLFVGIDREAIRRAARQGVVFSAEEHNVSAGFGSAVAEVIAEEGLSARLVRIGMPDAYSLLGPPTHLYRHYGLDAEGIAGTVRRELRG